MRTLVLLFLVCLIKLSTSAIPRDIDELIHAGAKFAYIKSYSDGDDGDNERGYHKVSDGKGSDGYKHFDSFHKKDADKYGYETHSAFGKAHGVGGEVKGGNQKADYEDGQFKDKEVQEKESKNAYKVVDNEGDSNDYTEGNTGGYSGKYNSGAGESRSYDNDESDDSGHYEAAEDDSGNYVSEGNLVQDGGNSYDGEGDAESEQYSEGDEESDY